MTTKKKPTRKVRARRPSDRDWRRDLLARDIFTALVVSNYNKPRGPGLSDDQIWAACSRDALAAAAQFETTRAGFKSARSK